MTLAASELPASTADDAAAEAPVHQLIIRPRKGWIGIDWKELYSYRELLYFLVWRDIKVRYKQTVLGFAWAILQPLVTVIIFTLIFGYLAGLGDALPSGIPYFIYVFAGQLPWLFFANGMSNGGLSLVNQQALLTKIYLPRLFIPTAVVGGGLVDLAISFGVFGLLMALYQFVPSWQIVFLPLLVAGTIMATLGMTYALAATTVTYRDFRFLIPFMTQIWMYMSFVAYPMDMIPDRYQWIASINPMFGLIQAYRSAILGMEWHPLNLTISLMVAAALFVYGLFFFRKTERRFADVA